MGRKLSAKRRIEDPSAVSTKKSWFQDRREADRIEVTLPPSPLALSIVLANNVAHFLA